MFKTPVALPASANTALTHLFERCSFGPSDRPHDVSRALRTKPFPLQDLIQKGISLFQAIHTKNDGLPDKGFAYTLDINQDLTTYFNSLCSEFGNIKSRLFLNRDQLTSTNIVPEIVEPLGLISAVLSLKEICVALSASTRAQDDNGELQLHSYWQELIGSAEAVLCAITESSDPIGTHTAVLFDLIAQLEAHVSYLREYQVDAPFNSEESAPKRKQTTPLREQAHPVFAASLSPQKQLRPGPSAMGALSPDTPASLGSHPDTPKRSPYKTPPHTQSSLTKSPLVDTPFDKTPEKVPTLAPVSELIEDENPSLSFIERMALFSTPTPASPTTPAKENMTPGPRRQVKALAKALGPKIRPTPGTPLSPCVLQNGPLNEKYTATDDAFGLPKPLLLKHLKKPETPKRKLPSREALRAKREELAEIRKKEENATHKSS